MRKTTMIIAALGLLASGTAPALADQMPPRHEGFARSQTSCKAEAQALCRASAPFGGPDGRT